MASFAEIGQEVFREYVRSAVIIDDQWPENVFTEEEPEVLEEVNGVEDHEPDVDDADLAGIAVSPRGIFRADIGPNDDGKFLSDLQRALLRDGVLTCGLRYQQTGRDTAVSLARSADIVVLDWDLVHDDGTEALEILGRLGEPLRFICILTGQDEVKAIRKKLETALGGSESTWQKASKKQMADFRLGSLVFAIRTKEGLSEYSDLTVDPDGFLEAAIGGLVNSFGGLVQLAMLEMTRRHREHLPDILEHLGDSIDTAVLFEAGDKDSPVGPGGPFLEVLVDEWRSRLERDHGEFKVLSAEGRRAFGTVKKAELFSLPPGAVKKHVAGAGITAKKAARYLKEALPGLGVWLEGGCENSIPVVADVDLKESDNDRTKNVAWGVLSAVSGNTEQSPSKADVVRPLLRLDTFFHQQFAPPQSLTQGTVVRTMLGKVEIFLVCTTPLCDANNPSKVGGLFTFVRTKRISMENVLQGVGAEWYCVVKNGDEHLCLKILVKERVSLEVWHKTFDAGIVPARFSLGGGKEQSPSPEEEIKLHGIAQLRLDHALALSAASATDASRVGVNRVELIRSRLRRH
jgi:hypothetical protein